MAFDTYPAVDENRFFPSIINQRISESPELQLQFERTPRRLARNSLPNGIDIREFAKDQDNNGFWYAGPAVAASITGWPNDIVPSSCMITIEATNTHSRIELQEMNKDYTWIGRSASQVFQGWYQVGGAAGGTVRHAIPMSGPTAGYQSSITARNVRLPLRLPVTAQRYRIHVCNRNDADDTTFTNANLRLNQPVYIGKHKIENGVMTGNFSEAPWNTGFGPAVWLPNSDEAVSNWIDVQPLEANQEYLLSYSYYNPDGIPIVDTMATCWWNSATGAVNQMDLTLTKDEVKAPLYFWIEVEVSSATPALGWIGDSLLVGRGADAAMHDSPAWFHGMTHGVIPRIYGQPGGRYNDWVSLPTSPKWTRFSDVDDVSACMIQLGSNDAFDYRNNPENLMSNLTSRLTNLVPLVRQHISERIYYMTVPPRANEEYTQNFKDALAEWNDYLRTLPHGAQGCFEYGSMISNADGSMNEMYAGPDLVHLNTAGYSRLAQSVPGRVATAM